MSKLSYSDFVKLMLKEGDYSESKIKVMFRALSRMDKESRGWFIKCMVFGIYPDVEIEGFTVKKLMEDFSYTKVQSFLVFDWLKRDPNGAKYYIGKPTHFNAISEKTKQQMREYLKKKSIAIEEEQTPAEIDEE